MDHDRKEFVSADILEDKKEEPLKLTPEDISCLECDFKCIQGCV